MVGAKTRIIWGKVGAKTRIIWGKVGAWLGHRAWLGQGQGMVEARTLGSRLGQGWGKVGAWSR